jgi:hypothetical protein
MKAVAFLTTEASAVASAADFIPARTRGIALKGDTAVWPAGTRSPSSACDWCSLSSGRAFFKK